MLTSLDVTESDRLVALMEPVTLAEQQLLYAVNRPISHVYFPLTSVHGIYVQMADGEQVEVGTVGNEGMVGLPVFLGATQTPGQAVTQIAGSALRMPTQTFIETVLVFDGPLYRLLHRYTQAVLVQANQEAACLRLHTAKERLCRWLLLTHDRVGRDRFRISEPAVAAALRVRREEYREVVAPLTKARLIDVRAGTVTIVNRAGLEACSCECYRVLRAAFDRVPA